jgi:hypothetical protein
MRPTTTAMITLALAAATRAGCSFTSGREPEASHPPTAGASTHAAAAARSTRPPNPNHPRESRGSLGEGWAGCRSAQRSGSSPRHWAGHRRR